MMLRVYTEAYPGCNPVEKSLIAEVRKNEYVQSVCGNKICEEGEGEICAVAAISCEEGKKCEIPKAKCKIMCPEDCGQETIFAAIGEKFKLKINQKVKFKELKNLELKLSNIIIPRCEERRVEEPIQPRLPDVQPPPAQQQPAQTPPEIPKIKDKVVIYFYYWKENCPLCEPMKSFIEELKQKYPQIEYGAGEIPAQPKQSDKEIIERLGLKQGLPNFFLDDKIWTDYNNDIASEIESKIKDCLENGCRTVPESLRFFMSSSATIAPITAQQPIREAPNNGITGRVVMETQPEIISTQKAIEICTGTPYAIINIKGCQGDNCPKMEATDMKLALGERRIISGTEDLSITFLDYDRGLSTGVFVLEKMTASTVACPKRCKCDSDGNAMECWTEIAKCPDGTTLCTDGICRESCEITDITTECKFGCFYGDKCLPIGIRVKGKYCSITSDLLPQIKEGTCENNFECTTNVCVDDSCVSSGVIKKAMGWFKKLFGKADKEEAKEDIAEIVDCGASSECMEEAFNVCKPAKMSQQQAGPISEIAIVGLEGKKCVLKWTAGNESMTCKFENYALGMKDMGAGSLEQYCSGTLTYRLAAAPKMAKAPVLNSALATKKLSADPNDPMYSFTAHDPDGISEIRIIKSDFGQLSVKAEPQCAKEFTAELKFNPSDLPLRASVIDCGTPFTRQELQVDIQSPVSPASAPETQPQAQDVQEPISAQQKTPVSVLSKEQVKCKFIDPDLVQRCYADFGKLGCSDIIRKCYTSDGKFGCSWTGGITLEPIDGNGFRYTPDCVAEVQGEQGAKLTWKASCGGDSYTVIDRGNEDTIFMCLPYGSQIKGFLHAYWRCGSGVEEKSIEGVDLTTCKSSEIWKEFAKESCKNQGGIKDFSVSEECSITVQKEGVFISTD